MAEGVGECPLHVSEKSVFEKMIGQCPAIDRNKRFPAPGTLIVDSTSHDFFAASGLTCNHNRGITTG